MQNNNFTIFYVQQNWAFFESGHHFSSLFSSKSMYADMALSLVWSFSFWGFILQANTSSNFMNPRVTSHLYLNQKWMMTISMEKVYIINWGWWWWWYLLISDEISIDAACHLRIKEKSHYGKAEDRISNWYKASYQCWNGDKN